MPEAITLDARELEPPEPFARASRILHQLQPGQYLHMLHRRVPYPLFELCHILSLDYRVREVGTECYRIIIYFAEDEPQLQEADIL